MTKGKVIVPAATMKRAKKIDAEIRTLYGNQDRAIKEVESTSAIRIG